MFTAQDIAKLPQCSPPHLIPPLRHEWFDPSNTPCYTVGDFSLWGKTLPGLVGYSASGKLARGNRSPPRRTASQTQRRTAHLCFPPRTEERSEATGRREQLTAAGMRPKSSVINHEHVIASPARQSSIQRPLTADPRPSDYALPTTGNRCTCHLPPVTSTRLFHDVEASSDDPARQAQPCFCSMSKNNCELVFFACLCGRRPPRYQCYPWMAMVGEVVTNGSRSRGVNAREEIHSVGSASANRP